MDMDIGTWMKIFLTPTSLSRLQVTNRKSFVNPLDSFQYQKKIQPSLSSHDVNFPVHGNYEINVRYIQKIP
jgi:hypothetical protein